MTEQYTITVASDLVVIGQDSEMADLSNPTGELYALRYRLVATDANGTRKTLGYFESEAEALAFWAEDAPPVALWQECEPEYGSGAYLAHIAEHSLDGEWLANN